MSRRIAKQSLAPSPVNNPLTPVIEPLAVRRKEACRILNVGMTKLKELIRDKEVKEVRVGTASLIVVRSLREFLGETTR
jgi:excisionase family DNA binding protein